MSERSPVTDPAPEAPSFEYTPRTSTPTTRALAVSPPTTMQSLHHLSTDVQQSTARPLTTVYTAAATTEVDA
jgi:hypothetical protein